MSIQDLGFNEDLAQFRIEEGLDSFETGRVILEHKERYVVKTPTDEYDAELLGNLRFTAESRYDFPAVGDWVAFQKYDEGKGLIHSVYPRHSIIKRQAVGKTGQVQIIATNVDFGLIVQAVDRDFNLNRLERYLTICNDSKVLPIVILSKTDLIQSSELNKLKVNIQQRIENATIIDVNIQGGYIQLNEFIETGKTYCLLGSSGVGKSTLLNGLLGSEKMKTSDISTAVNKGKHTTSHRELIVLENGGVFIDNPGMREVGISNTSHGLEMTFETILKYAEDCRFKNCTHVHEKGCAILKALEHGKLDEAAYENYQKIQKEQSFFELDQLERKRRDKDFGKMIKHVVKQRKNNKF